MSSAYNGRAFAQATIWNEPIAIIWDHAVWANSGRGLRSDAAWWARHHDRLEARFEAWIAGPMPAADAPPIYDFRRADGN